MLNLYVSLSGRCYPEYTSNLKTIPVRESAEDWKWFSIWNTNGYWDITRTLSSKVDFQCYFLECKVSQNPYGWRRSSPTTKPAPSPCSPLTHVLMCHIHTFLNTSRDGDSTLSLDSLFNALQFFLWKKVS